MHFFNENVKISIKISLKFVSKGPINYIPALIGSDNGLSPARRQTLSESMSVSLLTQICVTRPQYVNSYC